MSPQIAVAVPAVLVHHPTRPDARTATRAGGDRCSRPIAVSASWPCAGHLLAEPGCVTVCIPVGAVFDRRQVKDLIRALFAALRESTDTTVPEQGRECDGVPARSE